MFGLRVGHSVLERSRLMSFAQQVEKSNLSKLRRRTGMPVSSCRKALEIHENDLTKALEWLNEHAQQEGLAKAQKLQGRKTNQGIIGILADETTAAMVEVSCETDFVARNQEFRNLVFAVTTACHKYVKDNDMGDENYLKTSLRTDELSVLPWSEQTGKTLSDMMALKIGLLGENMKLLRAVGLRVSGDLHVSYYMHPPQLESAEIPLGKYGSVLAFRRLPTDFESGVLSTADCGRQLCQHVVGMNPLTLGEKSESPPEEEETQMMNQEFLIDPTLTVGDFLEQNGVQIVEFVRYECGETGDDDAL